MRSVFLDKKYNIIFSLLFNDDISINNNLRDVDENDLPFLINAKVIGPLSFYSNNFKNFNSSIFEELKRTIYLNFLRNLYVLHKIYELDKIFNQKKIDRCWLKGIKDITQNQSFIYFRKMTDVDLYVNEPDYVRDILYDYGFVDGGYNAHGEWKTVTKEERQNLEREHYELYPVTLELSIPIKNSNIRKSLENSFRIFHKGDNDYTTDVMIDIHHQLTFDLSPKWLLKTDEVLPVMDNLDDLWFNIHKCYYEIINGQSSNIQTLWLTIKKIKENHISINQIQERMKGTGFFNEEAVVTMYKIAKNQLDNDEKERLITHLLNNIENKIKEE